MHALARAGSCPQPPRVRGKPNGVPMQRRRRPSTPACAGKTQLRKVNQPDETLNPRVCGENGCPGTHDSSSSLNPRVCGENNDGTVRVKKTRPQPPRVRGKPGRENRTAMLLPSTPACAGKTLQLKTLNLLMKHSKCSPSVQAKSIHLHQPGDDRLYGSKAPRNRLQNEGLTPEENRWRRPIP